MVRNPRDIQRGTAAAPRLRLVRGEPSQSRPQPADPAPRADRAAVARANLEAAIDRTLDPRDPRWRVALEAASRLEGSLLTFERRREVLAFAQRVGVRPFDANLIIASVQDRARRREPIECAMPVVALAGTPRASQGARRWWPYAAAIGIAVGLHLAFLSWLLR